MNTEKYYLCLCYDFGAHEYRPVEIHAFNLESNAYQWSREHSRLFDAIDLWTADNKIIISWYKDCFDAVNIKNNQITN